MRRNQLMNKQIMWGIKIWQLAAVAILYLFFAIQYWSTLYFTNDGRRNVWREALIDYFVLKFLLTVPLWWLYFRKFRYMSLNYKLILHLCTAPLWVFCWFHSYRYIQNARSGYYLKGSGIWWDVYIPGLFYFVQFSIFHLYDYYLQAQKQKETEARLKLLAYHSEVNTLRAQIQPHFLFNTLNSISASVPPQLEHTREMIADLADIFRYALKALQKEHVPLRDEINFVKQFLQLEKERFGHRLKLMYRIDNNLLDLPVPPMLLQPIVENAVKHGIAESIDGGTITISVLASGTKIKFEIADTGKGIASEDVSNVFTKGVGLPNAQKRLYHLFAESIYVRPNLPRGTKVNFEIPLNK